MAARAYRSAGLTRSLTLLWTFVLASAAILAVGAFVISSVLADNFREQVLGQRPRHRPVLGLRPRSRARSRKANRGQSPREAESRSNRRLGGRGRTAHRLVEAWQACAFHTSRTKGVRSPNVMATVRSGDVRAAVGAIQVRRGGKQRSERVVVAWAPLSSGKGRPVGVAQVFLKPTTLDASTSSATRTVWVVVGVVFAILWLALVILVRGAAARLTRQNDVLMGRSRDLSESSLRMEENLLETIETLNAAVEARDPYTAGHSQRVRRVALAIGRELSLNAKQLGTLGTAALFHDVGKIGIPDSILTKAGALEPNEAVIMREHVTRGAEIVSKVSSFQDIVHAIRHHHVRWEGLGYPDGQRGNDIPLEAAIIGLADAWDAMTTDRPYAHGLTLNQAMLQIRSGREKQFNPAVVDAFWRVAKRHPSDILPPEVPAATVVAV